MAVMCTAAAHEIIAAVGINKTHRSAAVITLVFAVIVPFWVYFGEANGGAVLGILVLTMCLFAIGMTSHSSLEFSSICIAMFAAVVVPYLLSSVIRLVALGAGDAQKGRLLVYVPIIGAFASDTFAYLTGRAFGKHKLCPEISPKKTVEGSVGGFIMAPVVLSLYVFIISRVYGYSVSYHAAIACGVAAAFAGQLGDLAMSYIKRRYDIKDFGKLFPGHGGVLDRFDSVLFAAPVCEVIMLFLPVIL